MNENDTNKEMKRKARDGGEQKITRMSRVRNKNKRQGEERGEGGERRRQEEGVATSASSCPSERVMSRCVIFYYLLGNRRGGQKMTSDGNLR